MTKLARTAAIAACVLGLMWAGLPAGAVGGGDSAGSTGARPRSGTLLATLRHSARRYSAPGVAARGQVPGTWRGAASVLPVIAKRSGWVEVRLAQRPDGSVSWLPMADVMLGWTPYRIVINVSTRRLTLYQSGRWMLSAPAGLGALDDPTPHGEFFVAFVEPPPVRDDDYGPFVLVTSAHSLVIHDWSSSGDAVIGIHGPLGEDAMIGTDGAYISHGCIRLHLGTLLQLRHVPPGTPISIIG